MAIQQGVSNINLLPKKSFEFSTSGKVLKWTTKVGRILVVVTEFVVLLAFASRFYFDKKLDDLGEALVQKQAQIAAYAQIESDIRKIIAKQQPIESYEKSGLGFVNKVSNLTQIMPLGTALDTLTIDENGLSMMGKSQSEYGFAQLLSGVKKLPGVMTVNLQETSFDQTSGGVKFSIRITYK